MKDKGYFHNSPLKKEENKKKYFPNTRLCSHKIITFDKIIFLKTEKQRLKEMTETYIHSVLAGKRHKKKAEKKDGGLQLTLIKFQNYRLFLFCSVGDR